MYFVNSTNLPPRNLTTISTKSAETTFREFQLETLKVKKVDQKTCLKEMAVDENESVGI